MWKDGISKLPYNFDFNKELKELIRKRDEYKCRVCEKTQEENKENLTIHHIDYNKKNSNPFNLISLCRKCHARTNHNRDYWTEYLTNIVAATTK